MDRHGLLALQAWLDVGSVGVLYGLVALQSAAFAINNPARSAIIPRLVEPRLLAAANALQTISWSIALTVGPLVGAFLVALWGYGIAYSIDVVLFAAALWAVWRLPAIPPP
ncbi:MFS transporter [Oerskovia sp. M15]